MKLNNTLSVLPIYDCLAEMDKSKEWAYGAKYALNIPASRMIPFFYILDTQAVGNFRKIEMRDAETDVVISEYNEWCNLLKENLHVKKIANGKTLVYCNGYDVPYALRNLPRKKMYLSFIYVWNPDAFYLSSDVFKFCDDEKSLLKIEWRNQETLYFDGGEIPYSEGFHNELYVDAEIALPDYTFSEDGEERDGIFYPKRQLSQKIYRFAFMANEALCDAIRLIRLSDYVNITEYKKLKPHSLTETWAPWLRRVDYKVNSFLPTVEWQEQGYVASVSVEFETDTIVKMNGKALYPQSTSIMTIDSDAVTFTPEGGNWSTRVNNHKSPVSVKTPDCPAITVEWASCFQDNIIVRCGPYDDALAGEYTIQLSDDNWLTSKTITVTLRDSQGTTLNIVPDVKSMFGNAILYSGESGDNRTINFSIPNAAGRRLEVSYVVGSGELLSWDMNTKRGTIRYRGELPTQYMAPVPFVFHFRDEDNKEGDMRGLVFPTNEFGAYPMRRTLIYGIGRDVQYILDPDTNGIELPRELLWEGTWGIKHRLTRNDTEGGHYIVMKEEVIDDTILTENKITTIGIWNSNHTRRFNTELVVDVEALNVVQERRVISDSDSVIRFSIPNAYGEVSLSSLVSKGTFGPITWDANSKTGSITLLGNAEMPDVNNTIIPDDKLPREYKVFVQDELGIIGEITGLVIPMVFTNPQDAVFYNPTVADLTEPSRVMADFILPDWTNSIEVHDADALRAKGVVWTTQTHTVVSQNFEYLRFRWEGVVEAMTITFTVWNENRTKHFDAMLNILVP